MQKYLIAKATNQTTGQTVMHRNLSEAKFRLDQRKLAEDFARQYALKISTRTGETWTGYVEEYTPGKVTA